MALGTELGNAEIRVSCGDAERNSQRRMPADAPIRHYRILTKEHPAAIARLVGHSNSARGSAHAVPTARMQSRTPGRDNRPDSDVAKERSCERGLRIVGGSREDCRAGWPEA
jgi:hypothetical protein